MANIHEINLDSKPSPAILAHILGMTEPMVYKHRETGKLPPNLNASYVECIQHYVNFLKTQAAGKSASVAEAVQLSVAKKNYAQTEREWLDIRIKRGEFAEYSELKRLFEPVFTLIQSGLMNVTRQFPATQTHIDALLRNWNSLGVEIVRKAGEDGNAFVQAKMEEEVEIEKAEEDITNRFGIGEIL